MNFFFDANISWRLCNMIAAFEEGNHVVTHITRDKRFEHNNNRYGNSTKDVEFLEVLSRDELEWVVISGDSDIVDTAHERAALIESGLTFFAFDDHWAKADAYGQARKLVGIWAEIVRYADVPDPVLYRVNMGRRSYVEVIKSGMRAKGGRFRS